MAPSVPVISKDKVLVLFIPYKLAMYRTRGTRFLSLHISTYSNWNFDFFLRYFPTNAELAFKDITIVFVWKLIYIRIYSLFLWRCWARRTMVSSLMNFLDHTKRRTTFGRNPLDERSARRRDLYPTTHNNHKRHTSMPPAGFETTISTDECKQTYALDRAATGMGLWKLICLPLMIIFPCYLVVKYNSCSFTDAKTKSTNLANNLPNSKAKKLNP
jgi:hypothetical protein